MAASSKAWRWILRPACALLLLLGMFEAGLKIAAWFVKDGAAGEIAPFVTNRQRVLFLGDSNTYGLYLERSQAYPVLFEQAWNERHRERPIEVLNLAYPGMNSSRILRELPRILLAFQPDTILMMVGSNDYWTAPVAPAEGSPGAAPVSSVEQASFRARLGERLWEWSRVYRLLFMLRRMFEAPPEFAIETNELGEGTLKVGPDSIELGWERSPYRRHKRPMISTELVRNLIAISELTRNAGVRLLLLTYPAERRFYGAANQQLRRAAAEASIPLVDLTERFRPACQSGSCDLLFEDQHPTASGHALAAEHLIEQLGPHGLDSAPRAARATAPQPADRVQSDR